MATKKTAKKAAPKKEVVAKKPAAKRSTTKHEIVVRVEGRSMPEQPLPVVYDPEKELSPEQEGKKLVIPATWMSEKQILKMVQKTPPEHVYKRPGKGGQSFDYVTGHYVTKVLNFVFGWMWDFEIMNHGVSADGQVWVMGKLTVKDMKGNTITKTQFGRADIKLTQQEKKQVDFGNDLKAAATDALKKCASQLGIASDIYGKGDMKDAGKKPVLPPAPEGRQPDAPKGSHGEPRKTIHVPAAQCVGVGKDYCGNEITKAEADYSMKLYGKELCRPHQAIAAANKRR